MPEASMCTKKKNYILTSKLCKHGTIQKISFTAGSLMLYCTFLFVVSINIFIVVANNTINASSYIRPDLTPSIIPYLLLIGCDSLHIIPVKS